MNLREKLKGSLKLINVEKKKVPKPRKSLQEIVESAVAVLGSLAVHSWLYFTPLSQPIDPVSTCTTNPRKGMVTAEERTFVDELVIDLKDGKLDSMSFADFMVTSGTLVQNSEAVCLENIWSLNINLAAYQVLENKFRELVSKNSDAPPMFVIDDLLQQSVFRQPTLSQGRPMDTLFEGTYNCDSCAQWELALGLGLLGEGSVKPIIYDNHVDVLDVVGGNKIIDCTDYDGYDIVPDNEGDIREPEYFVARYLLGRGVELEDLSEDIQVWFASAPGEKLVRYSTNSFGVNGAAGTSSKSIKSQLRGLPKGFSDSWESKYFVVSDPVRTYDWEKIYEKGVQEIHRLRENDPNHYMRGDYYDLFLAVRHARVRLGNYSKDPQLEALFDESIAAAWDGDWVVPYDGCDLTVRNIHRYSEKEIERFKLEKDCADCSVCDEKDKIYYTHPVELVAEYAEVHPENLEIAFGQNVQPAITMVMGGYFGYNFSRVVHFEGRNPVEVILAMDKSELPKLMANLDHPEELSHPLVQKLHDRLSNLHGQVDSDGMVDGVYLGEIVELAYHIGRHDRAFLKTAFQWSLDYQRPIDDGYLIDFGGYPLDPHVTKDPELWRLGQEVFVASSLAERQLVADGTLQLEDTRIYEYCNTGEVSGYEAPLSEQNHNKICPRYLINTDWVKVKMRR